MLHLDFISSKIKKAYLVGKPSVIVVIYILSIHNQTRLPFEVGMMMPDMCI